MNKKLITASGKETQQLGEKLVKELDGNTVIALYGDLGSGKTTFVQGVAHALGIENNIQSPTFLLMKEYEVEDKSLSIKKLYHLDLYRLSEYSKDDLGLSDILEDKSVLVVIEWADRIKGILPQKRINVFFEHNNNQTRSISFEDSR